MIPAIGYTMCGADRRRLQTTASHEPLSTAVEFDLDCLSHGLDSASGLETERATLHAVSLPVGSADCRTEPALSRLTEIARKSNAEAVIARLDAMPTTTADGSTVSRPRAWKAESADLCRQVEFDQSRLKFATWPIREFGTVTIAPLKLRSTVRRSVRYSTRPVSPFAWIMSPTTY